MSRLRYALESVFLFGDFIIELQILSRTVEPAEELDKGKNDEQLHEVAEDSDIYGEIICRDECYEPFLNGVFKTVAYRYEEEIEGNDDADGINKDNDSVKQELHEEAFEECQEGIA